ncbi:hypothetical protein TrVE_jg10171 [Triparma verrucosa]|uniref:Mitochondrial carrier protein n=1 Tax=Triparma verrucosa TaxID=1606542 RepID=A0A9W7BA56_9STRA|nr:hypothetical protein TrVE_jg10171 [Triparma verrucosa]
MDDSQDGSQNGRKVANNDINNAIIDEDEEVCSGSVCAAVAHKVQSTVQSSVQSTVQFTASQLQRQIYKDKKGTRGDVVTQGAKGAGAEIGGPRAGVEKGTTVAAFAPVSSSQSSKGGTVNKYLNLPPALAYTRPLVFFEAMICGAVSRSTAQTIMHPANTMKTILQSQGKVKGGYTFGQLIRPSNFKMLTRGAGAQFLLSVPHGACNFAVLETTRRLMAKAIDKWSTNSSNPNSKSNGSKKVGMGPALDFASSAIATVCCSVVSTPQMMITDNIMCGNYDNLLAATSGLYSSNSGIKGFYTGWWPGLAGKIPSYGLTWVLFQQVKRMHLKITERQPTDLENTVMGCIGSAATVSIMIPMDTVKTRLVTMQGGKYKGIVDCARTVFKEEGMGAFYKGLPPRLLSVVPMIGIQFGCYEFMKKLILYKRAEMTPAFKRDNSAWVGIRDKEKADTLGRISQEVGVDDEQPFPAPGVGNTNGNGGKK